MPQTTDPSHQPAYTRASEIVHTLNAAGHQAYLAGGCVRDLLLHRTPSDYDVATSATPEEVIALFTKLSRKTLSVGAHFGVVLVCPEHGSQDEAIEVATFRHDGAYSDGRRPDAVRFSTDPREDVLRRDFTINGMLLDIAAYEQTGNLDASILDYVEGRVDLTARNLRAIGNPTLRFTEDKLRMLRAIRFAARFDFTLDPATEAAIRSHAEDITQVSLERTRDELTRMLIEGHAARAFELLDATNLLPHILPEALKLKGVQQPPEYHPEGDVWTHTLLLLENLPPNSSATLAWGALLHDIGKPATYQPPQHPGDRIRFNGHVEVGVRLSELILARLRFSREDTDQILALVRNHMRFGDILKMKRSTLTRFLRLPRFEEHLALHYLDCTASHTASTSTTSPNGSSTPNHPRTSALPPSSPDETSSPPGIPPAPSSNRCSSKPKTPSSKAPFTPRSRHSNSSRSAFPSSPAKSPDKTQKTHRDSAATASRSAPLIPPARASSHAPRSHSSASPSPHPLP